MKKKFRVSSLEIKKDSWQMTTEGYLELEAYATRTGVFDYYTKDGKLYREYRPAIQVHNPDSYKTLEKQPLTKLHPKNMLDSKTTEKFIKGIVLEGIEPDGIYIKVKVRVFSKELIDLILSGKMTELSCGYYCEVIDGKGVTPDGIQYDGMQINIIYNHLAVVPKGRAGSKVGFHLDSEGFAVYFDDSDFEQNSSDSTTKKDENNIIFTEKKNKMEFIFKGKTYKLDNAEDVKALQKAVADEQAKSQAKIDSLEAQLHMEVSKNDSSPEKLTEALNFITEVSQYIKNDSSLEALAKNSKKDNMILAIKDSMPSNFKLKEDASDTYIETLYDLVKQTVTPKKDSKTVPTTKPEGKKDALDNLIEKGVQGTDKMDEEDPAEKARNDQIEKSFTKI